MTEPVPHHDATQAGVMAAFLRVGAPIDHASSLLLALGVLGSLAGLPSALAPLALLLGMAEKYIAWRAALDAELFAVLARGAGQEAAFDAALGACLGRDTPLPQRTLAQRWQGARRFLLWQIALLLAQALLLVGVLLLG
jgi:hypothetical protein